MDLITHEGPPPCGPPWIPTASMTLHSPIRLNRRQRAENREIEKAEKRKTLTRSELNKRQQRRTKVHSGEGSGRLPDLRFTSRPESHITSAWTTRHPLPATRSSLLVRLWEICGFSGTRTSARRSYPTRWFNQRFPLSRFSAFPRV